MRKNGEEFAGTAAASSAAPAAQLADATMLPAWAGLLTAMLQGERGSMQANQARQAAAGADGLQACTDGPVALRPDPLRARTQCCSCGSPRWQHAPHILKAWQHPRERGRALRAGQALAELQSQRIR